GVAAAAAVTAAGGALAIAVRTDADGFGSDGLGIGRAHRAGRPHRHDRAGRKQLVEVAQGLHGRGLVSWCAGILQHLLGYAMGQKSWLQLIEGKGRFPSLFLRGHLPGLPGRPQSFRLGDQTMFTEVRVSVRSVPGWTSVLCRAWTLALSASEALMATCTPMSFWAKVLSSPYSTRKVLKRGVVSVSWCR